MSATDAILIVLCLGAVFLGYDLREIRKSLEEIHRTLRDIEHKLRSGG
jgi:hypothetical protein